MALPFAPSRDWHLRPTRHRPADRLWLVADGTVKPFDGDLDEYRALLAERARLAAGRGEETGPTRRDERRERAEARTALAGVSLKFR